MPSTLEGQVTRSAADIYEEFFVPALFQGWAASVSEAAALAPGQSVLDVACGTGVLAREAAVRVQPDGRVVGLDRNDGMLAVARRATPTIEWIEGRAEYLPFEDACFDAVVSQFGLMFFEDRAGAVRDMWRVLRPGGRLAVAVWDALDRTPGYTAVTRLLACLFGDDVADAIRAPYILGEPNALSAIFSDAGVDGAKVLSQDGVARFPSIESWVHTDIKGWTLADILDDAQYQVLLREAEKELQSFVQPDGTVAFGHGAHIVVAQKPEHP